MQIHLTFRPIFNFQIRHIRTWFINVVILSQSYVRYNVAYINMNNHKTILYILEKLMHINVCVSSERTDTGMKI